MEETGGRIETVWEYNTDLFTPGAIDRLMAHYNRLLEAVVLPGNDGTAVAELPMMSDSETRRLLYEFNDTGSDYPRRKTIHQLFEEQAEQNPDAVAVIGYREPTGTGGHPRLQHMTYGELNQQSNRLADLMRGKGVEPGAIAAIITKRSVEMMIGILGVLKAGGAYLPIPPTYPQDRIHYMLADSQAKILLSRPGQPGEPDAGEWRYRGIDIIDLSHFDNPVAPQSIPQSRGESRVVAGSTNAGTDPASNPAYIIYTSGSTGRPKGVVIPHGALVNFVYGMYRRFNSNFSNGDTCLSLTSISFDVCVAELFIPLSFGSSLFLMPDEIIFDVENLSGILVDMGITFTYIPPALLKPVFQKLSLSKASVGLSKMLVGVEPIPDTVLEDYQRLNPGMVIINAYGPTEATICATAGAYRSHAPTGQPVPIGGPLDNTQIYILAKNLMVQPQGVAGELCIAGSGLAAGYLNNPELTAEKFIKPQIKTSASSASSASSVSSGPPVDKLYKTGDLARWLQDGNIEFLGRIDQQVKIRGHRIEPGEIESCLLEQCGVRQAVVMDRRDKKGDKYLCAYIVTDMKGPFDELSRQLRAHLAGKLPDYMIPSYFTPIDNVPLTPSGKVDRQALPEPETGAETDRYAPPENEIEEKLLEIWQELLGTANDKLGIDANFFEAGGHSLKATLMVSQIHKAFNVKLPLAEIFKAPTIRGQARIIADSRRETFYAIEPTAKKEYYPLSSAQKRIYILQQMDERGIGYNMPAAALLHGEIDFGKLENTFRLLVQRHESLRTSFHMVNEEPVQRVHDCLDFTIENIVSAEPSAGIAAFIRPFDLTAAPLLRVGLMEIEKNKRLFLVDMHHIISDGVSQGILVKEFMTLADNGVLPELRLQYRDYAGWQNGEKEKAAMQKQEAFWLKELEREVPVLDFPLDYPRPAVQSFEGGILEFEIEAGETGLLKDLAFRENTTLFMLLLTLFNTWLSKLCGQEDVVVGTPVAGRRHADLAGTIGMFVNTLALRNYPSAGKSFSDFLVEVKSRTLTALENQDYPFEDLVEKVDVNRNLARNPLFDVLFVLQNMESVELEIPGLKLTPYDNRNIKKTSKFDLTLQGEEKEGRLVLRLEYCTKLFKQETITRFFRYFKKIAADVLEDRWKRISEIEIMPREEKQRVLFEFNDTAADYPRNKTIHRLFEEQVERTPDGICLAGRMPIAATKQEVATAGVIHQSPLRYPHQLTYRELNKQSNLRAVFLRKKGVQPGSIIGIKMQPSVEMVVCLIAVFKAGGGYLPIDPSYPLERIRYMLEDSRIGILLSDTDETGGLKGLNVTGGVSGALEIIDIADGYNGYKGCKGYKGASAENGFPDHNQRPIAVETGKEHESRLAYIIYTSGSTGKPKGAGVFHRGFVNLMHWFVTDFGLSTGDSNLLLTSPGFDLTQKNFYASLITGGTLCFPRQSEFEPRLLVREICDHRVTWINCTPSMFARLVEYEEAYEEAYEESRRSSNLSHLRIVFLGGEPISMAPLLGWLESERSRAKIVNTYGPTECTDICAAYPIREPRRFLDEVIPIGKPVSNVQLYVSRLPFQPLPPGVPGELMIGGEGVGVGYINDEPLTSEKFIPCDIDGASEPSCLYRTGDLVKWRPDGNLEFLGRIDHQVKVRGFRVELGEIESRLREFFAVKEAVVTTGEDGAGDRYLCAYIVPEPTAPFPFPEAECRQYLSRALPDYMAPGYFVFMDRYPLNPNGKINLKALPDPRRSGHGDCIPPANEWERRLAELWGQVLGLKEEKVSVCANFFHQGGHSLKAVELIAKIHRRFQVEIPLTALFANPSIRQLALVIEERSTTAFTAVAAVEKKAYYPLSPMQKRLYLLQQMEPESTAYNIPYIIPLAKDIVPEKLEDAFKKLIQRHESLRTSFFMLDEAPVQVVHDNVALEIKHEIKHEIKLEIKHSQRSANPDGKASGVTGINEVFEAFFRPFELSEAPLLRVAIVETTGTTGQDSASLEPERFLLMDMHHIITDGASQEILKKDLFVLYAGESLTAPTLQYRDYAEWRNKSIHTPLLAQQEEFWKRQFSDEIPVLTLPYDYPRPVVQSFEGNKIPFELNKDETRILRELARANDTTPYMTILSIFAILLSKLSGQEDIVFGTATAGRRHADLENIIGMFVNTLALRIKPGGGKFFEAFLRDVKKTCLQAFENQDYQFEDLVDRLSVRRDVGRNPIFDVMFNFLNQEEYQGQNMGISNAFNSTISKFDLTLSALDTGKNLAFSFEYSTKLFMEGTINRFITYFKGILQTVANRHAQRIEEIEIITEAEKRQILYEFNDTAAAYPREKTIHFLFAEQVERTPDGISLAGQMPSAADKREDAAAAAIHQSQLRYSNQLTYRELNETSNGLANRLRAKGVEPGVIVAIQTERSVEMIVGLLGILKAGGAYLPIDPDYPEERIHYILKDSNAAFLVETSESTNVALASIERIPLPQIPRLKSESFNGRGDRKHRTSPKAVHSGGPGGAAPWPSESPRRAADASTQLCYAIYTSGSTGKPKGVMIEHGAFVNFIKGMTDIIPFKPGDSILSLTTISFDIFGLETLLPLTVGARVVIGSSTEQREPDAAGGLMKREHVSIFQATPSRLQLMLSGEKSRAGLAGLGYLLVGGEALPQGLLDEARKIVPGKIVNVYGPTETTVWSTAKDVTGSNALNIGKPIANTRICILDRWGRLQPSGIVGELCIGGDGLARGYINNPELTAERFATVRLQTANDGQQVKDKKSKGNNNEAGSTGTAIPSKGIWPQEALFYRTGDLARWLPEGNIEFLGRMDHQVKIRGFRIELGEIENRLLAHRAIKEAVVMARRAEGGDTFLCAYYVENSIGNALENVIGNAPQPAEALKEFLSRFLPAYMVPSYFVKLDTIPLTANGKVNHKVLSRLEISHLKGPQRIAPQNKTEEKLSRIWADILGVQNQEIGMDDDFFHIGGHSLKAAVMAARLHKTFNIKLPLTEIFKHASIRSLAKRLNEWAKKTYAAINPVEKKEYYATSSAQKRLYVLQQMEPGSAAYNMPNIIPLAKDIDVQRLEEVFKKLIQRHESLRTSFFMLGESPVQVVHDTVEFEITHYNLSANRDSKTSGVKGFNEVAEAFFRPFELSKAPLLRVALVETTGTTGQDSASPDPERFLLMDMHHIVTDGVSQGILEKDLFVLYAGENLTPPKLQYRDYAEWRNRSMHAPLLEQQEEFWKNQFSDEMPVLTLPHDYPRPVVQSFAGNKIPFHLNRDESGGLRQLARENDTTLYMAIVSVFSILLSKLGGQEDVVIGTAAAGRRHADLENIIGMFVNTLAIRTYPDGGKSVAAFLKEVKETSLQAFENQEYPFEDLVDRLSVRRDAGRNPIFDVMFNFVNQEESHAQYSGITVPVDFLISKFDLTLSALDTGKNLAFSFEYSAKLFEEATIYRFITYFKGILQTVSNRQAQRIEEIGILTEAEKRQILYEFNDTATGYPREKTIHLLFGEQVERTPDRISAAGTGRIKDKKEINELMGAVALGEIHESPLLQPMQITYRELDEKSNRLAHLLQSKGVKPGAIIAIMVERSIEMIIGLLGILKAGGAYLPIEPDYPRERIHYMLKDSQARLLLKELKDSKQLEKWGEGIEIMDIHSIYKPFSALGKRRPASGTGHSHAGSPIAYILYTSGTTGAPKAVMVKHRSIVRLVADTDYIDFSRYDKLLQTGALSFDASTFEIWGALKNGLTLHLENKETILSANNLKEILNRYGIDVLWMTSALFNYHVQEDIRLFKGIKHLLVGGDVVSPVTVNRLKERYPGIKVSNCYGPTENTTFSTVQAVEREYLDKIPIGKPIANSTAYIMDNHFRLCPIGVPGELLVGGDGLALGYLNNPELTAEKFITAPAVMGSEGWEKKNEETAQSTSRYPLTGSKLYRTGDLARWLPEGNIEFLGRMDRQVKIRGFRIELAEIEARLLLHPGIKEVVVQIREAKGGDATLCAYYVAEEFSHPEPALKEFLSGFLPDYMIPSFFIELEAIPLTTNGKIDGKALSRYPISRSQAPTHIAPRNETEERLREIWGDILKDQKQEIGIDDNFFEIGGHSLKATLLVSRIHKEFNVKCPLAEIFSTPTIRTLSVTIKELTRDTYAAIEAVEKKDYYFLSSAQKRLYILQRMDLENTAYNMPHTIPLSKDTEPVKLEEALKKLIQRHESLRTSFHMITDPVTPGEVIPVQVVHDEVEFKIETYSFTAGAPGSGAGEWSAINEVRAAFFRPFDLSQAPLIRAAVIEIVHFVPPLREWILLVDMHHIITDRRSQDLLTNELFALSAGKAYRR